MLLKTTRVISEQITIERSDETVGSYIDRVIAESDPDSMVTAVAIEITDDDRTALRLLRSPVHAKAKPPKANDY